MSPRVVAISVCVLVLAVASALIGELSRGHAIRRLQAETDLAVLQTGAANLQALEWEAIGNQRISPSLSSRFASERAELKANLLLLRRDATSPAALGQIERAYAHYARSAAAELAAIRNGDIASARALDEERTDPAGEALNLLVARTRTEFRKDARDAATLARIVGWATPIIAALAIGFLVLLVVRSHDRHAVAQAEQETLRDRNRRLQEIDRIKDDFVATVSHELRTPLTSIRGYLEMMLETEEALSPQGREFLGVIDRNSDRLLCVVSDLLFVAQADAGPLGLVMAPLHLRELIDESVASARPAAEARQIDLSVRAENVSDVTGDRARIAQLLDNLISNALKFTPPGGRVEVRLSRLPDGSAMLEVADTGSGISKGEQGSLFTRFFRTNAAARNVVPGTGLGLTIVKLIAEAHAGSVSVESDEGEGATFRVVLPLSPQPLPAAA
jgi:signal transduction histidine kinase